jgi:hypothetical protein
MEEQVAKEIGGSGFGVLIGEGKGLDTLSGFPLLETGDR